LEPSSLRGIPLISEKRRLKKVAEFRVKVLEWCGGGEATRFPGTFGLKVVSDQK